MLKAQPVDTSADIRYKTNYTLPIAILGAGLILNNNGIKTDVHTWVRNRWDISNSQLDDYLQHMPSVTMYALDMITKKPVKEVERQTRHLITSQLINLGATHLLKRITKEKRPSGGSHSFPSGHTSYAFAGAAVLWYTWKDENPWIAWSGYLPATITAVFRMIRDKHWISDVVFGAGLGILSAHMSYGLNLWNSAIMAQNDGTKESQVFIRLGVTNSGVGLGVWF
jgi:membrane-associated phospholipid phosphatase